MRRRQTWAAPAVQDLPKAVLPQAPIPPRFDEDEDAPPKRQISKWFDAKHEMREIQRDGTSRSARGVCPHCSEYIGRGIAAHKKTCIQAQRRTA